MSWEAIGTIAEIVGAVGVIFSLVYLAMQIRHTSRQTNSQALQVAIQTYLNNYDRTTSTAENVDLLRRGLNDFDSLNGNEKGRLHSLLHQLNHGFNSVLTMHRAGLLPEDELVAIRGTFIAYLLTPGGTRWWTLFKHVPPPIFVDYIEEAMRNNDEGVQKATEQLPWLQIEQPG